MTSRVCFAVVLSLLLVGCNQESAPTPAAAVPERFVKAAPPEPAPAPVPAEPAAVEPPVPTKKLVVMAPDEPVPVKAAPDEPAPAAKAKAKPKPKPQAKRKLPKRKMARKRVRVMEQRARVQVQAQRTEKLGDEIAELKRALEQKKLQQLRSVSRRHGWTPDKEPSGDLRRVWQEWRRLEKAAR